MSAFPTIDVTAPNNADGVWVRNISAIIAADPSAATAAFRIQVRASASDASTVLDIPNSHGSISYASGALTVRVPMSVMAARCKATSYVWDGIYTTTDGRTVKWFEGTFTVEQGVTR